jgi:zinc transport system substrate-binding protein
MKATNRLTELLGTVTAAVLMPCLLSVIGCRKAADPWDTVEGGNLKVLVSFPPLYCFTRGVADKDAKVVSLLAATGPHEHQPTADDARVAAKADLFLVNGLGLDEFVTKVAEIAGNKKVKIVEVAEEALPEKSGLRIAMKEEEHPKEGEKDKDHAKDAGKDKDHEKDHGKDAGKDKDHAKDAGKDKGQAKGGGHEGHHHEGEWDPHAWLGIEQAIAMVEKINETLKEADKSHAADYDKRAAAFIEKLKTLHADGKKMLADKKNRKIVATHESLAYFCKSFDLELVGAIMPTAGVDADAQQIAKLKKICKEQNVRVIAIEPQYDRKKGPETLQRALKDDKHEIVIIEIDPLETAPSDELKDGEYYLRVMRRNLETLAKNLE